jgi:uncharacterized protein (TIGR04255 family)
MKSLGVGDACSADAGRAGTEGEILYANPPLVETSLGVGFSPIPEWNVEHFGLYYHEIRARYPRFDAANPIVLGRPGVSLIVGPAVPKIRAMCSNDDRTRLVQVQDDLLFLNWQKMATESTYPRYSRLKAAFLEEWESFTGFLDGNALERPVISRQQITYINVIERTSAQSEALGLEDIYTQWRLTKGKISENHRDVTLSASYQIGEVELIYTLQPALRISDQQPVFQFSLATGSGRSAATSVDMALMDLLHDVLLAAFEEFTSDRAKALWEKIR